MNTAIKQVIVMRKDLNMRKGKMVAQGAHASMKVFLDCSNTHVGDDGYAQVGLYVSPDMLAWLQGSFAKICVGVNSEEELLNIYKKAQDACLPAAIIKDSGKTEFHGVPTHTCLAIGPARSELIDAITGELSLL